jgi:hypothetical protein
MADAVAAIVGTNASFTRTTDVTAMAAPLPGSALSVTVAWKDRTDQDQSVQLSTAIAAIAPELAGTLSVPGDGDVVRQPLGRNRGIPRGRRNWAVATAAGSHPTHLVWPGSSTTPQA